jgi:hypothetical protein
MIKRISSGLVVLALALGLSIAVGSTMAAEAHDSSSNTLRIKAHARSNTL